MRIALCLLLVLAAILPPSAFADSEREHRRLAKPTCTDGTCRKACGDCCDADPGGTDCTTFASDCPDACGPVPAPTPPPVDFVCPYGQNGCVCEGTSTYCSTSADCPLITSSENKCSKSGGPCSANADCPGNGNNCRTETTYTQIQCEGPKCGDGFCDTDAGESCSTCPLDCGVCDPAPGDVGATCTGDADCAPGLACNGSVCVFEDTCCSAWCKDADGPNFNAWDGTFTEAWVASVSSESGEPYCGSGSGCTCTMSSFLADTWTIVTGGICDSHNFNPTCTDWVNCQDQCDAHGPIAIGGRYDTNTGACICMATVNGVTKDIWKSTCSENDYTGVYPACPPP